MHPGNHELESIEIMKQEDAGVVPVRENGRLTGMVIDRDKAIRVAAARGVVAQADIALHGDGMKTGQVVQEISE